MNSSKRANGQALTEFVIIWPLLLLSLCLLLQVFLLWWAQQTFVIANQYAVRAGAINHGARAPMVLTLSAVMAGLKPQLNQDNKMAAAAESVLRQRAHFLLYGKLTRLNPDKQQLQRFGQRRWLHQQQRYVHEIAVDHYQARQAQSQDPEWAKARRLSISSEWCFDLQIPLAAEFLGWIARRQGDCLAGNLAQRPQWPLRSGAEHELLSGFRGG
ncbi:pilus assembly protein [Idiomarina seosinensis]|uniref:pilus assembly protein n=1 Tax=Idiomarina seosinensis TaxID=281739 RepID=UPI00384CFD61